MHWLAAFLLASTMLVAIVGQQWGNGMWQMLPAAGFLWRALLLKAIGSGRFGLDALITTRQRR